MGHFDKPCMILTIFELNQIFFANGIHDQHKEQYFRFIAYVYKNNSVRGSIWN